MLRYKIILTFFILLAIAASCLGFYYTLTSNINIALKAFIYILLLIEVFIDLFILVKVWLTTSAKE